MEEQTLLDELGNYVIPIEAITFEKLYNSVCHRLRSSGAVDEVMKAFMAFNNNIERITYVAGMRELESLSIVGIEGKNERIASALEKKYDSLIAIGAGNPKAKIPISKSIQMTPVKNGVQLAIRYMKRSWASFTAGQFDHAFIDARRSLDFDAPSELMWNAYEIMGYCCANRNQNKKSESFFKLALEGLQKSECSKEVKAMTAVRISSVYKNVKGKRDMKEAHKNKEGKVQRMIPEVSYGRHKVLESATSVADVIVTKESGRGLFATKCIKPGDFIIVENPYVSSMNFQRLRTHCYACFQRIETPVPCHSCSLVWYCDEVCQSSDNSDLHACECKILPLLYDSCLGDMSIVTFRILQKATWSEIKSLREHKKISEYFSDENEIERTIHWKWEGKYLSNDYLTTYNLVTNVHKRSFGDLFKRCLASVYIVYCLKYTNFFGESVDNQDLIYVASLALHHFQGGSCNAYGITEYRAKTYSTLDGELEELGGAIYPTVSLTNHCCWPNTVRYTIGKTCIMRASRTIEKNEQIYDNYGPEFSVASLKERKELLANQYKFDCLCKACVENWSPYPHKNIYFTLHCPEPNCSEFAAFKENRDELSCNSCGGLSGHKALGEEIKRRLKEFHKSLLFLKQNNVNAALAIMLDHQLFLDKYAIHPGRCLSDSRAAIKQCFFYEGNHAFIDE